MAADFGVSCGHTEYSNIRFEDGTRHMVIFEAAHDLPELETFRLELPIPYRNMAYRVRLFLTDAEYKTVRLWAAADKVRILHQLTQPADHPVSIYHPEGEYLKGLVLYVE